VIAPTIARTASGFVAPKPFQTAKTTRMPARPISRPVITSARTFSLRKMVSNARRVAIGVAPLMMLASTLVAFS
jgi:hypothetical protein